MRYLCSGYYDPQKFNALPKDDLAALIAKCRLHDEALHATGKVTFLASLSAPKEWKSIKPGDSKPVITDGPFSEAKEVVGAFFIVDAENMDEAVSIASMHPAAHLGKDVGWGIDVRACEFFIEGPPAGTAEKIHCRTHDTLQA